MLGSHSNPQLRSGKPSRNNIVPLYDRRLDNGMAFNKVSLRKTFKMAVTWKTMFLIGELFSGIFTWGMFLKYGIGDVKTLIGIFFLVAFGVIRLLKGWIEYQEKKQSLRERIYDFNRKIAHDKELSLKENKI